MSRWCGPFPTPNIAGLEIASALLITLAIGERAAAAVHGTRRAGIVLVECLIIVGLGILLTMTESRAAMLELVAGTIVLLYTRACSPAKATCVWMAVAISAMIHPQITEQALSSAHDASLTHRFLVWRAALACACDHALAGVGRERLPDILSFWYLGSAATPQYASGLNDVLSWAAAWGFAAAAALMATMTLAMMTGLRHAQRGDPVSAAAVSVLIAHEVGGCFQAVTWYGVSAATGFIACLVIALRTYVCPNGRALLSVWSVALSTGVGVAVAAAMLLAGRIAFCSSVHTVTIGQTLVAAAVRETPRFTYVLVTDRAPTFLPRVRDDWGRPLLRTGTGVVITNATDADSIAACVLDLTQRGTDVCLVAWGESGNLVEGIDHDLAFAVLVDASQLPTIPAHHLHGRILAFRARFAPFAADAAALRAFGCQDEDIITLSGTQSEPDSVLPVLMNRIHRLGQSNATVFNRSQ